MACTTKSVFLLRTPLSRESNGEPALPPEMSLVLFFVDQYPYLDHRQVVMGRWMRLTDYHVKYSAHELTKLPIGQRREACERAR